MKHHKIQEMMDLATIDADRLKLANSPNDARIHWTAFLEHSNRAINRLERYSKTTKQEPKYRSLLKEIWKHPVASYMRACRNAHEHGVEDIDLNDTCNFRTVFPNGIILGSPLTMSMTPDGIKYSVAESVDITHSNGVKVYQVGPTIRMLPIDSKGGIIYPYFLRELLHPGEPETVAAARLYLGWIIEKINDFD